MFLRFSYNYCHNFKLPVNAIIRVVSKLSVLLLPSVFIPWEKRQREMFFSLLILQAHVKREMFLSILQYYFFPGSYFVILKVCMGIHGICFETRSNMCSQEYLMA